MKRTPTSCAASIGLTLCGLLSGCMTTPALAPTQAPVMTATAADCAAPAIRMARVELLFGATWADGSQISATQWDDFLAAEVTPRFPEGLTELSGRGQWRRPDGAIAKIPTRVLLIWYVPSDAASVNIEAIRGAYKTQFKQLSVMRVTGMDCVAF